MNPTKVKLFYKTFFQKSLKSPKTFKLRSSDQKILNVINFYTNYDLWLFLDDVKSSSIKPVLVKLYVNKCTKELNCWIVFDVFTVNVNRKGKAYL